jgi:hypothetical protein
MPPGTTCSTPSKDTTISSAASLRILVAYHSTLSNLIDAVVAPESTERHGRCAGRKSDTTGGSCQDDDLVGHRDLQLTMMIAKRLLRRMVAASAVAHASRYPGLIAQLQLNLGIWENLFRELAGNGRSENTQMSDWPTRRAQHEGHALADARGFKPIVIYPIRVFLAGSSLSSGAFAGLTLVGRSRNIGTWSPMPTTGESSSLWRRRSGALDATADGFGPASAKGRSSSRRREPLGLVVAGALIAWCREELARPRAALPPGGDARRGLAPRDARWLVSLSPGRLARLSPGSQSIFRAISRSISRTYF